MPRYAGMPAAGPAIIETMFSKAHPWAAPDEAAAAAAIVRSALTAQNKERQGPRQSLRELLASLEPLDEDFAPIADPPPEPAEF